MAARVTRKSLPTPSSPFRYDLVKVLDPRIEGRTMSIYLMTKEVRMVDETKRRTSSGIIPYKTVRMVCSPMVSYNDPNAIYEVMDFTVVDPRFVTTTVQVCHTLQEALALRQSMTPTNVARAIVASGDKIIRLQCYIPKCPVSSSKMEKLRSHILNDHLCVDFDPQKVKMYRLGGPHDPSVIRSSSTIYNTLPPPIASPVTALMASQTATSMSGSLKRRRGPGVTDLHIPSKVPRVQLDSSSGVIANRSRQDGGDGDVNQKRTYGASAASPETQAIHEFLRRKPIATDCPAEENELFCICLQPGVGKQRIECANGAQCLLRWFHLDCVNLTKDEYLGMEGHWYCRRCIEQEVGGARNARIAVRARRDILQPQSIKIRLVNRGKGKEKAVKDTAEVSEEAEVPKPSPSVNMNLWSADMIKAFVKDPDNIKDFDLGSLEQARAALLAMSKAPLGRPKSAARERDEWGRPLTAAGTLKTPNSRSWTTEEEKHLKEVVEECVDEGLSGEPLWRAAHPRLVARGVKRPMGGMKMRWCRGLREETKIDERRKKNERKMITALQGPKTNKQASTPKARFKSKGTHLNDTSTTASSPIRNSAGVFSPSNLRTAPIRNIPTFNSINSSDDREMRDGHEGGPDSAASDDSIMRDLAQVVRRRGRSV